MNSGKRFFGVHEQGETPLPPGVGFMFEGHELRDVQIRNRAGTAFILTMSVERGPGGGPPVLVLEVVGPTE